MKLKAKKKSMLPTSIKRQAIQGLEGFLKGGRGYKPLASLYQKKYEIVLN
jgi:hypothetical protein